MNNGSLGSVANWMDSVRGKPEGKGMDHWHFESLRACGGARECEGSDCAGPQIRDVIATLDWIDGWRKESNPIGTNVNWVRTKFMLIDPLGKTPITLAGSANFSLASVSDNDESMLLIRGDTRVADIFFGEFMRVFAHHRFWESVKRHIEEFGTAAQDTWKRQDLFENWRKWVPDHFRPGSEKDIKRQYFAG